ARAGKSGPHRDDAARRRSFQPDAKRLWRAELAEMAIASLPRRSRLEDQSGACCQGTRALRQYLRGVSPRARRRPRIRRAVSGQELLVDAVEILEAGPERRLDPERGPEERGRHGNGSSSGQRAGDARGSGPRLSEDGPCERA